MADTSVEFQQAIYNVLTADADIVAEVGTRVYDGPQANAELPYISFGPADAYPEDADCLPGMVETLQIDIWTSGQARMWPCKQLTGHVRSALHGKALSLATHACGECRVEVVQVFRDNGNKNVAHGVVQVSGLVEER